MSVPLSADIKQMTEEANRLWQQRQHSDAFRLAGAAYWVAKRRHRANAHPDVSEALYYLGNISWSMERVQRATVYLERSLAIDRRMVVGLPGQGIAQGLNSLGTCKNTLGDFRGALRCFAEAETIIARLCEENPDSPDLQRTYSATLRSKADTYRFQGNFLKALEFYNRSLDIERSLKIKDTNGMATTINGLASTYDAFGNLKEALRLYEEALAYAYEYFVKPERSRDIANLLHNRSNILVKMGDYTAALEGYQHALTILLNGLAEGATGTLSIAATLSGLAKNRMRLGDIDTALENSLAALQMRYAIQGRDANHPDIAMNLHNLADIYVQRGEDELAIARYEEALAMRRVVFGDYDAPEARDFGSGDHSHTAETLYFLAKVYYQWERYTEAWDCAKRSVDMVNRLYRGYYTFLTSEVLRRAERVSFLMQLTLRYFPEDSVKARAVFESVSQYKTMETQLRLDMRAVILEGRYPEQEASLSRWREINQAIAFGTWDDPRKHALLLQDLEQERHSIEQALFRSIPELRQGEMIRAATAAKIAATLPSESVLIEYLRFHPADSSDAEWQVPRYAAFVVPGTKRSSDTAEEVTVTLVDLGPAAQVDEHVTLLRESQSNEEYRSKRGVGLGRPARRFLTGTLAVNEQLERLFAETWEPLQEAIGAQKRILIAPDGELNYVPFEALVPYANAGHLVDFGYRITYLSSGRDLLRYESPVSSRPGQAQEPLIIGDPDFGLRSDSESAALIQEEAPNQAPRSEGAENGSAHPRSGFGRWRAFLNRLPFSAMEAERIARRLQVAPFLGSDAQARLVQQAHSPRILHLATHAFYLTEAEVEAWRKNSSTGATDSLLSAIGTQSNAFLKGVVCFAGARTFLDGGVLPATAGSGVLVGEEIIMLDLRDTELVNLSVCNGGVGMADTGRGVMGLRAAFQEAGCRRLVVALWSIDDIATAILMDRLYYLLEEAEVRGDSSPLLVDDCLRQAQQYLRTVTAKELMEDWYSEKTLIYLRKMRTAATDRDDQERIEEYIYDVERMRDPKYTAHDSHPFDFPCYWSGFLCQGDPSPYSRQ